MSKQAGKGDKPRPVNKAVFNENYDLIDWGRTKSKPQEQSSKKNC